MIPKKAILTVLCLVTLSFIASPTYAFRGYLVKKLIEFSDEIAQVGGRTLGKTVSNPRSSKLLAESLKAKGQWPKNAKSGDYAAHHIIPTQLSNHPVLIRIGMDMNNATNGIALPTKPGLHPTLPLHRGSHPSYTNDVRQELDKISLFAFKRGIQRRVSEIQQIFRDRLVAGVPLHRKY